MSEFEQRLTDGGVEAALGALKRGRGRPRKTEAPARDGSRDDIRDEEDGRDAVQAIDQNISDEERFAMFVETMDQQMLPNLPQIPGYHVCWLTTSNLRDTIANRERMGYTPVLRTELRGWAFDTPRINSGSVGDDLVRINEMVAYKIPLGLYNRFMRHLHDVRPREEEEKIRASAARMKEQAAAMGARLDEGDGAQELARRAPPMPEFTA